jgi:hypothetical protein
LFLAISCSCGEPQESRGESPLLTQRLELEE